MVKKSQLPFQPLSVLRDYLLNDSLDANDLLDAVLERIHRLEKNVNSFITIVQEKKLREDAEEATRALRKLKRGRQHFHSLLLGIPVGIKDNTFVKGLPCTAGSRILQTFVPKTDAPIVRQLRRAGSIIIGKTNLHEFAMGITTDNPLYGPTRNPWMLDRIPGGSSGGSAAGVAAGFFLAATGTDTGGSVRVPAALCGVSGLKPTYGRFSTAGIIPVSPTLDHVGLFARGAEDIALLLSATCKSFKETKPATPKKTRIGIPRELIEPIDGRVYSCFERAIGKLTELGSVSTDTKVPTSREMYRPFLSISFFESFSYHKKWLNDNPELYGKDLRDLLSSEVPPKGVEYRRALRKRRQISRSLTKDLCKSLDILALPTVMLPAPRIGEQKVTIGARSASLMVALIRYTYPFNLAGLPAISIPCGFVGSLPVGLELASSYYREETLLRVASSYQRTTDYHEMVPSF